MKGGLRLIVERWNCTEGFEVDVMRNGILIRTGRVDMAALAGDCVWIAADGIDGRMLVHRNEGYILLTDKEQAHALKGLGSQRQPAMVEVD